MQEFLSRWAVMLKSMSIGIAGVTALSVAMAVWALIADPLLALLFAFAAVLLDAFKCLAWPLAFGLLAGGRHAYGALCIATALALGGVSAWANFDRLQDAILTSQARQQAVASQRMTDLQAVRADALQQVESLDRDSRSIGEQARQLRERGIVSKAQQLEDSALPRIASQREQAMARLDAASRELTELRSNTVAVADLPRPVALLLCAGFALVLEIVPALILSVLRLGRPSALESIAQAVAADVTKTTPATPVAMPRTLVSVSTTGQQQDLFGAADDELFEEVRSIAKAAQPGTPIPVRSITDRLGVGNRRVLRLFRTAMDLGVMRKTTAGYVAA